ncbi:hypothetical protein J1605_006189 [Eschrichtius robustus]|uniref:5-demethoxyubiquinone hydroxylase, mitochondrial n=1 Tax=Eschrichtius robustus TaxID=9764 RepID=A0AB34H721_ESCRO|nr:hypothetical protein J1605_006189 [Eschrichtius robustus]
MTLDSISRAAVDRIIRVDHAGEYGANRIYAGQMAVLGRTSVGPVIQKMWDQEKDHLKKFNELMVAFRVRPTILMPFWNVVGFALGAGTALLGKEGAMACTVAVEESIAHHYNNQIRMLMEEPEKYEQLLQIILEAFKLFFLPYPCPPTVHSQPSSQNDPLNLSPCGSTSPRRLAAALPQGHLHHAALRQRYPQAHLHCPTAAPGGSHTAPPSTALPTPAPQRRKR